MTFHKLMAPVAAVVASITFAGAAYADPASAKAAVDAAKAQGVVGEQADGFLGFVNAGAASADGLREWAPLARFAAPLRGQAAWRGTLHAADGRNELTLQSNLVGMQIELPAPLNAAVIRAAGAWGLTRNDLLIALLLKALAPEVPDRLQAKRRREIAIASVINIRGEFGASPDAATVAASGTGKPSMPGTAPSAALSATKVSAGRIVVSHTKP